MGQEKIFSGSPKAARTQTTGEIPYLQFDRSNPAALLKTLFASKHNLHILTDRESMYPVVSHASEACSTVYVISPYQKYVYLRLPWKGEHIISMPFELASMHGNMVAMLKTHLRLFEVDELSEKELNGGFVRYFGSAQPLIVSGKSGYYGTGPHELIDARLTDLLSIQVGWDALENAERQITQARRWSRLKDLIEE